MNPYKELSDTFGLFVKDKEVIKALQGFVNPKSRELAIAKPSKVRFYYFDEKSDTPFGIHISRYLEPDSMKKEDDLILDNPFYKEICKESGQPDSKEEKIDNLEIGDTRFLAKWITADEELSFSIVSEYFESNSPERFNYEIRLFNLSAMRPHIERAVDIIKAYNENNN
nr:hypothetical protein 15 [Candidatus Hydrogenedentota bacterium]